MAATSHRHREASVSRFLIITLPRHTMAMAPLDGLFEFENVEATILNERKCVRRRKANNMRGDFVFMSNSFVFV